MTVPVCLDAPKPYLHPVLDPDGNVLTAVSPPDHPWHRGLWFAVKYVDGENFWEEVAPFGRQEVAPDGIIRWVRADGTTVVVEDRVVSRVAVPADGYAIDWDASLVAPAGAVLDRTPFTTWGGYGGLAFRGSPAWTDTSIAIDGLDAPVRRPEGVPGRWCDLFSERAGLLFLDHPHNPCHPVPWYGATRSRVYGDGWSNFLNAAFLFNGPLTLAPGEPLRLRYRVIVHRGGYDAAACDRAWREWVGA